VQQQCLKIAEVIDDLKSRVFVLENTKPPENPHLEHLGAMIESVGQLEQDMASVQQTLRDHASKTEVADMSTAVDEISAMLKELETNSTRTRKELISTSEEVQHQCLKIAEVSSDLNSRVSVLENTKPAANPHLEQLGAMMESVGQLEQELSSLQAKIEDIIEKEGLDVSRLGSSLDEIRSRLRSLLDKGASATARCLSCREVRTQNELNMIIGTDGKTYRRRPSTPTARPREVPQPRAARPSSAYAGDCSTHGQLRKILSAQRLQPQRTGGSGAPLHRHRQEVFNAKQYVTLHAGDVASWPPDMSHTWPTDGLSITNAVK